MEKCLDAKRWVTKVILVLPTHEGRLRIGVLAVISIYRGYVAESRKTGANCQKRGNCVLGWKWKNFGWQVPQ